MKNQKSLEAVYIYIYIERFNVIEIYKFRINEEARYFRRN